MADMLACVALHVRFKLTPIFIRPRKVAFGRIVVVAIKSPMINTTSTLRPPTFRAASTRGAVQALFETERPGAVALDVTEGVVVGISTPGGVDHFPYAVGACDTVDTQHANVPDTMIGIVVDHHGNTINTKMVR